MTKSVHRKLTYRRHRSTHRPQTDRASSAGDLLKAGSFGAVALAAVSRLEPLAARAQRLMSGAAAPAPKGSLIFIPNNPGNYNLPIDVGFHEALIPLGWSFQQLTPTGIQNNASFISLVEEAIQKGPNALAVAYPGGGAAVSQIKQAASSLQFVIVTNQEQALHQPGRALLHWPGRLFRR